ncbi:MAG: efflux RND transporter periplasmic adaptor subunit [Anaerolineales bacterium]|nr:efflux RND transporter periplasmic adaptor subunit [Anaerolineales bacterium]
MKRYIWLFVLILILTACSGNPTPVAVSPAATSIVETTIVSDPNVVVASAVIAPAQISELGFTVSALVKETLVMEGEQVRTGQPLIVLDTPELEFAVTAAEFDYKSKSLAAELQKAEKVKYVNPDTGKIRWYSLPREVYLKALSKADQAKAVWDSAAASLAESTLIAPYDGTVVDLQVIPGEIVQPNQVVLTLADLKHLQIETTDLSERDITRVQLGQSVDVYIEALDVTVTGKVIRISPISKTVGGDVVYPVTIELGEQPAGLLWGMTAEVQIQTK